MLRRRRSRYPSLHDFASPSRRSSHPQNVSEGRPKAPTGQRPARSPSPSGRKTKALSKSTGLPHRHRPKRPMWDSAHGNGPARISALKVVSVIDFTVMTACNLLSWEYSRDKPGTQGHKRL
jgi:hypothetical protein